jgi:hypothetical protein
MLALVLITQMQCVGLHTFDIQTFNLSGCCFSEVDMTVVLVVTLS